MSSTKKVMVEVPRSLTWDKLAALYWMCRSLFPIKRVWKFSDLMTTGLVDIHFNGDPNPPEGAIDIDARYDYKHTGHGSATEKVVEDRDLFDQPGVRHAVDLLNENNGSGFLKSFDNSLVWLIREFFNVGAEIPSRERRIQVIDFMWPAMEVYCLAAQADEEAVEKMRNPFTLSSFSELCEMADVSGEMKDGFVQRFEAMFAEAKRRKNVAVQKAGEIETETFTLTDSAAQGHIIRSDNTRIAAEYFKAHRDDENLGVLVVYRRSRNVAIFCRGTQSFEDLFLELDRLEPGIWFLDTRNPSPMLLNGSTSRAALPTELPKKRLIELIQTYYRHSSKPARRK